MQQILPGSMFSYVWWLTGLSLCFMSREGFVFARNDSNIYVDDRGRQRAGQITDRSFI